MKQAVAHWLSKQFLLPRQFLGRWLVVQEEGELIGLSEKIFFKHNEYVILRRSFAVLEQVAKLIKQQKQIKKVRIEGHTDDTGGVKFNLNLSQERADAVKMHLVGLGVEMLVLRVQAMEIKDQLLQTIPTKDVH